MRLTASALALVIVVHRVAQYPPETLAQLLIATTSIGGLLACLVLEACRGPR